MKKAYAVCSKEFLEDMLQFSNMGLRITDICQQEDGTFCIEVAGDGLPDECADDIRRVSFSYIRNVDKPTYSYEPEIRLFPQE
jgi:hypothetical protein